MSRCSIMLWQWSWHVGSMGGVANLAEQGMDGSPQHQAGKARPAAADPQNAATIFIGDHQVCCHGSSPKRSPMVQPPSPMNNSWVTSNALPSYCRTAASSASRGGHTAKTALHVQQLGWLLQVMFMRELMDVLRSPPGHLKLPARRGTFFNRLDPTRPSTGSLPKLLRR